MIEWIRKRTKPVAPLFLALPVFTLIVFLIANCASGDPKPKASADEIAATRTQLQTALNVWRESEKITGATMSVYSPTYGQLDLASGLAKRSIDPDRFPDEIIESSKPMFVGDLTHVLVAATVIELSNDGRLDLKTTIDAWHPEIENSDHVSIRNLLEHTSGIPVFYTEEFLDVLYEQQPNISQNPEDVIAVAAAEGSFFPPGSQYGYSKTNFIVLGRIIERVTGNSLESELRSRFFTPLAMNDTFLAGHENIPGGIPLGYEYAGPNSEAPTVIDGHVPQTPNLSIISAEWASGALVSTPADIIKLIRHIFESNDLANVRSEMLKVSEHPAQISGATTIESGAGVFTWQSEEDEPVVGQFGFIYPFSAQFVYWPNSETIIVVIANEVDSSRNPDSNFQLPVIETLTNEVKKIVD